MLSPNSNSSLSVDEELILALQLNDLEQEQADLYDQHPHAHFDDVFEDGHFFDEEDDPVDYDDYDEDYGDIRLAPPALNKPPRVRRRKSKTNNTKPPLFTKIIQPIVDCPRPLVFPLEVLDLVCSHLSQATLRHCVSLVCKKWNSVSDRYIRRVGVWTPMAEDYEKRLLQQMQRLDTLECWFGMEPDLPNGGMPPPTITKTKLAWDRFIDAILVPLGNQDQDLAWDSQQNEGGCKQKQDELKRTCLLHNIQHLYLRGQRITFEETIAACYKSFSFLQTLNFDIRLGAMSIPLFDLLDNIPSLCELTVKVSRYEAVYILSGDEEDAIVDPLVPDINPETAHFPVKPKVVVPPKAYSDRYRLRVFDVQMVVIKQRVLERIIATCPKLQIFKAMEINTRIWERSMGYFSYPIDQTRLVNHAKNLCPNLEWYTVFPYPKNDEGHPTREPMKWHDPDTKFLSLTCCNFRPEMPDSLLLQTLFSQITVLEIMSSKTLSFHSTNMNKVLCFMPNLLHLLAPMVQFQTTALFVPPAPVEPVPPRFIYHNKYRKKVQRKEKRKQRQEALLRFQHVARSSPAADEAASSSRPLVWKCRNLRTLDMRLYFNSDHFPRWTEYVDRNRLFRNLTSLKIAYSDLKIGQLREFPHVIQQRIKSLELKAGRSKQGMAKIKVENELQMPSRFPNELLPLQKLKSLELVYLEVHNIPGMLHPTDLEFLRQWSTETIVRFISNEDNKDGKDDADYEDHDNRSGSGTEGSEPEYVEPFSIPGEELRYRPGEKKPVEKETFWPRLQAFHIRYFHSNLVIRFEGIADGMRAVRPGVEFSIKQQFTQLRYY
ncbi:hypothetical protein BGZ58_006079 [Dissophora ornata]|nr:hypothetical protein BGZ58_006079 [Dissophora ornata]